MVLVNINNKDYQLRLAAKACVEVEKKLGENPLNIFVGISQTKLPPISKLIALFGAAIKPLNHGISDEDVYDLYDKYIEEGHTITDFINLIINVLQDAGFIPKEEDSSKN